MQFQAATMRIPRAPRVPPKLKLCLSERTRKGVFSTGLLEIIKSSDPLVIGQADVSHTIVLPTLIVLKYSVLTKLSIWEFLWGKMSIYIVSTPLLHSILRPETL